MTVAFFVAALACPHCGQVSPADTSTNMATHLQPNPRVNTLRVCEKPDVVLEDFKDSYITLREPQPNEQWRVIQTWTCPSCRSGNWAEVVFNGKHIGSIENAELTAELVSRAHFISDWVDELFERVVGESMYVSGKVRGDFAQKLIEHLK